MESEYVRRLHTHHRITANGVGINLRYGGSGPPLLLLHGYPQTHVMWHKVALITC